jgi:hypothetical protein
MLEPQRNETVVRIEAMPTIVADHLVRSLAEEGIDGSVVTTGSWFEVQVTGGGDGALTRRVGAALERLVLSEGRPLVPEQVGPMSFVLRPAAG